MHYMPTTNYPLFARICMTVNQAKQTSLKHWKQAYTKYDVCINSVVYSKEELKKTDCGEP